ncbi:MAG: VWA domain-containing protein, partial [Ruminococcus sp.]
MHRFSKQVFSVLAILLSVTLISNIFVIGSINAGATTDTYDITAKINETLNKSIKWISDSQSDEGSWGDNQLINDTAYGMAALRQQDLTSESGTAWLEQFAVGNNSDVLARKLLATGNKQEYALPLLSKQNSDGGFGVESSYTSEVYDTVLALEAFESLDNSDYSQETENMILFLASVQNSDGSWSCNQYNDAENALTARVAYDIISYLNDNLKTSSELSKVISSADVYLSNTDAALFDMSENSIESSLYYSLLKQEKDDYTDVYNIVQSLVEAQNSNGSFYDNVYITYLAIKYLSEIKVVDEKYSVSSLKIDLSNNTVYTENEEKISGTFEVKYNTVVDRALTLVTNVYDDDKSVYSQETAVDLSKESEVATGDAFEYTVNESSEKVLKIVSELKSGDDVVASYTNFIYVQEKPIVPKTEVTDAGIKLSDHYGYTGERKTVTADYFLLYSTNVSYALNVRTYIYCDDKLLNDSEHQVILTPESVNAGNTFAELDINTDSQSVYKFVAEIYDGEKLLYTATDVYEVYKKPVEDPEDPEDPENPEEPEKNNVITQFSVTLDNYFLYTGNVKKEETAFCEVIYSFSQDTDITVKGYVLDGEEILKSNEQSISVSKENTSLSFELIKISDLDISEEKKYIFKAEMYDSQGNFIGERTAELNTKTRPEIALTLTADTNTGEDYSIDLLWNDISSSYEQYGYRVLRSSDEGKTWETRSSWNGSEKVSVLNVYPHPNAERYLKDWMNRVVDKETGETAGKGLFDIDTVYFDNYNSNPEEYLKDSNGMYKYDVILFGTYDCNNNKDLNEKAKQATQSFINSGRGVLFGHDTVCWIRPGFAHFANQIGIIASPNQNNATTSVAVVNQGFLTSFPWSISGNLSIPSTHNSGQMAGGTLDGKVWMKLNGVNLTVDPSTGAVNDAYLITNNQVGFIQTGHSSGQATDDECKVFANTLFYLKQLTSKTTARDNSFYDTTAPDAPEASVQLTSYSKDSYGVSLDLSAKDNGTKYYYKTEAIPKSDKSKNVFSNTIVSEAFADLKGFVVLATDSQDTAVDEIKYEDDGVTVANVISAENGKAVYSLDELNKGQTYYLHIFAVDNANNISAEYIKEICDSHEILSQADIESTLTSDKYYYCSDDTAVLTAKAYTTGVSINARAVVEIYDLDGNLISTVADDVNTQLSSSVVWSENYTCSLENFDAGRYMADVTWYVSDTAVSESKCQFNVINNETPSLTLSADVKSGADYSAALTWNDLNENSDRSKIATDYSVVVDVSGSMSGQRIKSAKEAISSFVNQLSGNDRLSLVKFASSGYVLSDFTSDKEQLNKCVSSLRANGGTSVNQGLTKSVDLFENNNNEAENYNKVIVLICDGDVDNCNAVVNKAVEMGIAIYTINVVNADSSTLQNIANVTGGRYYFTNVVTDMTEIMQYIKLVSDKGDYYYQVLRDGEIIEALTVPEYKDGGFIDTAAPKIKTSRIVATELGDDAYSGYIDITAEDYGTDYEYVVNAVDKDNTDNIIYSNRVNTTALSGIKGYFTEINTSDEPVPEIINNQEYFTEAGNSLSISLENYTRGTEYYLHMYAVDNAGNISEEKQYKFVLGKNMFVSGIITTDISTDKQIYYAGDNAIITVSADNSFYKTFAKGVIEILDGNGTVVDTVESNYLAEIVSYESLNKNFVWNVKDVVAGEYYASVKWYDGSSLLASDTVPFEVASDGTITDRVTTDKLCYTIGESILVSDSIFNNTTNTYNNNMQLSIDIYDDESNKIANAFENAVSTYADSVDTYSDYVQASDLGVGNYTAVSKLSNGKNVLASSKTYFSVIDYSELTEKYTGKITVQNNSDKDKNFRYSVSNVGNKDGNGLTVIVKVYTQDGTLVGTIEKPADIASGGKIDFSELFNTEALKIGTYAVTLSIADSLGNEAVLDNSGFEISFINKYNVVFVNEDGTVLEEQQVEYGSSATAPKTPVKEADAQYTYTFEKWDKDFSNITKDLTVTAVYSSTVNKYTVTFVNDDGTVLEEQQVEYGSSATA